MEKRFFEGARQYFLRNYGLDRETGRDSLTYACAHMCTLESPLPTLTRQSLIGVQMKM